MAGVQEPTADDPMSTIVVGDFRLPDRQGLGLAKVDRFEAEKQCSLAAYINPE
jgi:hypothetical protein